MAGAGKTTLARQLENTLSGVRLCPDEWIEPLLEDKLREKLRDKSARVEMDRLRPHIEQLQWTLAKRLLVIGNVVIWEQGFWHSEERHRYLTEARDVGARVALHYLDVPVEELKRRVEMRNESLPPGSFHVAPDEIDLWMSWFQPPDSEELKRYNSYRIYRSDGG
jgi:predicted kinase